MRVLVTGASGLIGTGVCDALLARGDEVVGLTRDAEKAKKKNPTVRWHSWDATSERPPPEALEGVDGVVNLIGETLDQRWTEAAKRRITDSRVVSTRNLVQAIAASEVTPRVFVGQSAIGYYGDRGEALVDEDTEAGDDFGAEVCVAWERAQSEAGEQGMRVAIFRSGLVLSRHGGLLKRLLTPFKLGVGGPLAGGEQYMSWIHIDDEIQLILWALDDGKVSGVLNATAPAPVTNRELSKALGRAINRPAVVPVPKLVVTAMLGREAADTVTGGQRVMPRRATDLGYRFKYSKVDEAVESALKR